ncbi:hypothetical protein [Nocardioides sp.]|uniref:hypothetical protein n=1 Tax=Nocardioides sp. TaxID=35761 RepID=UPI002BD2A6FB|nr:hypothetical protein [Nocardioides sp.]HSX67298.1 hypothetical protein [Nocardioides sp.]
MYFGIALLLVVVLPMALTAAAYGHAKRYPTLPPVTNWRGSSRASRPRRPSDPGYAWGVALGIVGPYLAAGVLHLADAPAGVGVALFVGAIVTCWAIHFFTRKRTSFFGAVPWGMVLGSVILPCLVGLVLVPILAAFGP